MDKEEYQKLLDSHDWFYEYSDDGRVWRAGYESKQRLLNLAKQNPEFAKMYDAKVAEVNRKD